jgi:hypothetical protein
MLSKEANEKLSEAVASNRFFITISYHDGMQLQHFWVSSDFLDSDFVPSLEHLRKEVSEKKLAQKWE